MFIYFQNKLYGAPFWNTLVKDMDPDQLAAYQAYVAAILKKVSDVKEQIKYARLLTG